MAVESAPPRRKHVHFSLEGASGQFLAYGPPDLFEDFLTLVHARACDRCHHPEAEVQRAEPEPDADEERA